MTDVAVFLGVSLALAYLSRRSLWNPRTHGFWRFFSFESILVLILLNANVWFDRPFSANQMLSWTLLIISLSLAIHAFWFFYREGKPTRVTDGSTNLGFENTTTLVTTGMYRFIRHPMYSSLLIGGWGIFLKDPGLAGFIMAAANSTLLTVTARIEENENAERFGDEYRTYRATTKMFIPYFFTIGP
ncbi:MAG: isoprenylcysteine carboxylmethyltransferase family protein [Ignavibacteriales bacterium]|nr:isoprenylcysteine carboxylmethyltransferase family protein [Ignavibacteriales bacterium]